MKEESDEIYRIRRELEDKLDNAIQIAVSKESSSLQWRYGSIIFGFITAAAIFGITSIQDIPQKVDEALKSEASTKVITEIEQRKIEINAIYQNLKGQLDDIERDKNILAEPVANFLLSNQNFTSLAKGKKGDTGPIGPVGPKGDKGKDGSPGSNGTDGIYSNLPKPIDVGLLTVTRNRDSRIISFEALLPDQVQFVTFLSESSFKNDVILPTKQGDKYSFVLSDVKYEFEVKVIVYFRLQDSSPLIPYFYSAQVVI